jgi:hypothetical protein
MPGQEQFLAASPSDALTVAFPILRGMILVVIACKSRAFCSLVWDACGMIKLKGGGLQPS